jgi:heterotetrameric sarcosine oxidase gamma subunit
LRADRLFISSPPGSETGLIRQLEAVTDRAHQLVTVSDLTHARAEVRLVGPASSSLLGKLCGVDLGPGAFADGSAIETSVAKIYQMVIRRDAGGVPSFALLGARSYGEYLWQALFEAGAEWAILPMGWHTLGTLAAGAGGWGPGGG